MKRKNPQIDVFNETFLYASLNAFEGDSKYFRQINAHFAALLTTYFKHYDFNKSLFLIEEIKKERAYKNHPFFPFFLKFLTGEKITSHTKARVLDALHTHPNYPLADYLRAMLSLPYERGANQPEDSLLLFIDYLNSPSINLQSLNILSKAGFALATFNLLLNALKAGDVSKIETLLLLTVAQNGGDPKPTTVTYLEKLLIVAIITDDVKQEVYRILVNAGATEYILPLVDLYEKSNNYLLAFFTLHLANALSIKGAASRLLAYYKRGENIPSNEDIIKYLKTNLN